MYSMLEQCNVYVPSHEDDNKSKNAAWETRFQIHVVPDKVNKQLYKLKLAF